MKTCKCYRVQEPWLFVPLSTWGALKANPNSKPSGFEALMPQQVPDSRAKTLQKVLTSKQPARGTVMCPGGAIWFGNTRGVGWEDRLEILGSYTKPSPGIVLDCICREDLKSCSLCVEGPASAISDFKPKFAAAISLSLPLVS